MTVKQNSFLRRHKSVITDDGKVSTVSIIKTDRQGYPVKITITDSNQGTKSIQTNIFDENHNMAFLGECGLACREQYDKEAGQSFVYVSRFNIGDFEIVPKPKPLLGDTNRDGVVNIDDATAIQRRIAELSDASFDETAADIDGNGLNINDATLIQMYLADIPVSYPIGKLKES